IKGSQAPSIFELTLADGKTPIDICELQKDPTKNDCATAIGPNSIELGDWTGRTSMIALLFPPFPDGKTLTPCLQHALNILFDPTGIVDCDQAKAIDPQQLFGFFTFPLKYRKKGFRAQFDFNLGHDFGLQLQAGVADICQTLQKDFTDDDLTNFAVVFIKNMCIK